MDQNIEGDLYCHNLSIKFSDSSDVPWTLTLTNDLAIHRTRDVHLDLGSLLSVELVKHVHGQSSKILHAIIMLKHSGHVCSTI